MGLGVLGFRGVEVLGLFFRVSDLAVGVPKCRRTAVPRDSPVRLGPTALRRMSSNMFLRELCGIPNRNLMIPRVGFRDVGVVMVVV